ncbi:MAG TPA: xylulokinase [Candidatus Didemnitutus sp.]|nr:xylulokinase [Candidatus Didemnitutus sp.]
MSLYLGIDSGTQSTKAVALDLDKGRIVAEARAPHRLITGLPAGHMEQHPADWVRALDSTLKAVAAKIDRRRVRGIGVSGQQHGFVPLDAKGEVIRPAKLWCDTSTAPECDLLTRKLGGVKRIIRLAGLPFLPGYTAPKILWLKRHEPANFKRLRHILLPHDYLNFHLTGNYFMEPGDASGTALLDVRRRQWCPEVLKAIDPHLGEFLPALGDSSQPAGTLRPDLARRYGFPADTLVSAGGGDNMMGAIGTGNVEPGVVTASFGTSGTIYAHSPKPVIDPRGEIAAFCDSTGGWMPLLCTMNVTLVTEIFRELFGHDHTALEQAVKSAPAGADGLILLPYLDGERTPNLPHGRGVLFGLTRANTHRGHQLRAAMEGVTLGMNYGLRRLAALGVKPAEIRLTGGGAKSAAWRQLAADIFGVPVVKMVEDEGAALGAAIQAAWCASPSTPIRRLAARTVQIDTRTRCRPDAKRHALYRGVQERYDALGQALRPFFVA